MGTLPPVRTDRKPSRARLGVLAFACTLSLLTYLDRVCISQVQKDIQFDLRISDAGLGAFLGFFALGYALFEVPAGWLGDRWGARRVLTFIVLWWSVCTALTGAVDFLLGWTFGFDATTSASTVLISLVIVRFLFGCGEAGAYPNLTRVAQAWFPFRERGVAMGAIWMSARLGGAISFLTIGTLATFLGWRMAFCVLGLVGAVWCLLFHGWFRNSPAEKAACNDAERDLICFGTTTPPPPVGVLPPPDGVPASEIKMEPPSEGVATASSLPISGRAAAPMDEAKPTANVSDHGHALPPLRPMLGSLTLWAMCVAAFGVSLGWYFFPSYQPKYLEEVHHLGGNAGNLSTNATRTIGLLGSPTGDGPLLAAAALAPAPPPRQFSVVAALLAGLPFLFGAAGSLAGGRLSDWLVRRLGSRRWGRSLVGVAGFGGAGLCVLATGFAGSAWVAVTLLCLAFLINDLAIPALWAASTDISGRFVGTVAGVMNMVGAFGAFTGMFLTPVIMDALPTTWDATERWRLMFALYAGWWFIAAAAWLFVNAGKPLFDSQRNSN